MAMMMRRLGRSGGYCACKMCMKPGDLELRRGAVRAAEERHWREDVRDLPQGESWLQDQFDAHTMNDGYWRWDDERLDDLPYWLAMKCLDEIYDGSEELPPGFDGTWSTDSAHVILMRKRNRMDRVHDSLRTLERAVGGNKYAKAVVKHPRFERVIE